jgi:protein tyrosine phosphatase (PTP) superfamily phosphohydrolase (DUF442 family)
MKMRRAFVFLGVLALCAATLVMLRAGRDQPAAANSALESGKTSTGKCCAEKVVVKGLDNFGRCNKGLCRGAQPDAAGYAWLKEQGFKTVVNFRTWHNDDEAEAIRKLGLTPLNISLQADVRGSEPPTDAQLKEFFEIVLDPKNQPVYIHCAHGKDRTGTMAALYRMEVDGWTADEAIEEMRAFGYNTIWQDLVDYVKKYKPGKYVPQRKSPESPAAK